MTVRVRRFRREVARLRAARPGVAFRFPAGLRAEAVAIAKEEVARGRGWAATAGALGVRYGTLRAWRQRAARGRFRRVRVAAAVPASTPVTGSLVVVTPGGIRVEGLDVEGVVALLGRLS